MSNKEYSPEEYEQALENVSAEWGTSDRDIDILQELVDRATPVNNPTAKAVGFLA